MNNSKHEQPIDDCEAKITPLDQTDPAISPLLPHPFLKSRFSPRQRTLALRLSIVLSLIVLVLLILPGGWQSLRNTTFGALSSLIPTPTPTLFPGEDSFYMNVNIPWPDQAPPIVVNSRITSEPSTPPDKVQLDDNRSCIAARDLLLGTFSDNFQVRFVSGPNPAAGCLAMVTGNLA